MRRERIRGRIQWRSQVKGGARCGKWRDVGVSNDSVDLLIYCAVASSIRYYLLHTPSASSSARKMAGTAYPLASIGCKTLLVPGNFKIALGLVSSAAFEIYSRFKALP